MESLGPKLLQLIELVKAIKANSGPTIPSIPSIKPPTPPSMKPRAQNTKIPGIAPTSNKDPKKIAEQIRDGAMSTKTQKIMLKWDQGWSNEDIEKADREAEKYLYHIHDGPYRITSKPLSIQEINEKHGGVKKLESSGFRLVRHTEGPSLKDSKIKS